ncbi:MAG: radical SAM protein [Clostridia bacterium]|nr:radical SAM protein [Clostridia bacterium]
MIKEIIKYGEAEVTYKSKQLLSEKPKLYNLFWETTLRCNAKCKHCGSRAGEDCNFKDELTTEEIENALESIANKYNANEILLNITGGEPLVRKDLFEVMEFARNLGYHWGMTTNAILINDDNIEKMKRTGMTTISISLDGLESSHDEFRGVKGSYSKIIENVHKLKKANFLTQLQITTVVSKNNINELENMYIKISELGIDTWRIVNMEPIGRAEDNKELILDNKDYINLINFIKEKRRKSKFKVTYGCSHFLGMKYENEVRDNSFFCVSGFTTASILYNGDIYVCPDVERRKELIQGNIRKDDFVQVWQNKFKWFRNLDKLKCTECDNCEDWKYCRGDSLHTWDFNKNKPKICLNRILERNDVENGKN